MAHVEALASAIGVRVAGTDGEAAGADYIDRYLTSLGYTVEQQEFIFETERFRPAGVVTGTGEVSALTIAGSGTARVEGRPVYVELGDEDGIDGQDLTGAVVIADRGVLRFVEKYEAARDAGAVGLVVINNEPGVFSGELGLAADFPVLAVAQEDGSALLAAVADGEPVSVYAEGGAVTGLNVVARVPGADSCEILVGGHYDTVPGAPGANDNASGTANVLEIARALAQDGLDPALCFVAFGAEESGLNGSEALVASLTASGDLPKYMVNLDVTGIGEEVEIIAQGAIADRALAIVEGLGIATRLSRVPAGSSSDHAPFAEAGVPTVYFTSGDFGTIHTPRDVVADIDPVIHDQVGDAALAVILDLLAEVAPAG